MTVPAESWTYHSWQAYARVWIGIGSSIRCQNNMANVIITKETRKRLLAAASSGQSISVLDFLLTRGDRDFQAELVAVATQAKNELFFQSLSQFLATQQKKYSKRPAKQPKPKPQMRLSPKFSPTGMSFQEFLEANGLYYCKPEYVHFVSGGQFESNRRRH
jgi:hypothetical protein